MLPNSITLQHENQTYSHPILYGEYIHETLYLIHPDKKIALNIPTEQFSNFIEDLSRNIIKKTNPKAKLFQINSFEFLAKQSNFKLQKHNYLLPHAIIFVPSQINGEQILEIDQHIQLTPDNSPIYFDYPKPNKTNFINKIKHLQKNLSDKKEFINFKYTHHSKQPDQIILTSKELSNPFLLKTPDFTLISETKNFNKPNFNQNILFAEDHPRYYQKGQLQIHTSTKTFDYSLDQSTSIIQTNIQENLTLKINNKTKAFDLFKNLSKAINDSKND